MNGINCKTFKCLHFIVIVIIQSGFLILNFKSLLKCMIALSLDKFKKYRLRHLIWYFGGVH